MSNFFDRSNNEVVRHSFGSTYGKTFEIKPLEKPKKVSEEEIMMESAAKFAELNHKVEVGRREKELDEKLYSQTLREGFIEFRDNLVKDIMRQICVEALLVDEESVLENLANIHFLVDNKVDEMGGYEGLKTIAENSQNPLLIDMYKLCESTANKVSERTIKESQGDRKQLSFMMNAEEEMAFDTNKKDLGADEVSEFVKDKVLTVVKDEQEKKQEEDDMMTEIQNELTDHGVQDDMVQEAMTFVFENKIEDTTLFDSMMRKTYKGLLEHGCSAILESTEIIDDEQGYPVYDVDDVELTDLTVDEDEEVKKLFLETGKDIMDGVDEKDAAKVKDNYDKLSKGLKEIATGCKKKSRATCVKESIREIQASTLELVEEAKCKTTEGCKSKTTEGCKTKTKESTETPVKDEQIKSIEEATREFIVELDEVCESLNEVIDAHEDALIEANQSLCINTNGCNITFPVIHQTDTVDEYLKFAYKTRAVCESVKSLLTNVETELEAREVGTLVSINLENINQALETLTQLENKESQIKVLESARFFMSRIADRLETVYENLHTDDITSEMINESVQSVKAIYAGIERESLIENTNNTHMETVMAETIVNYTIMEAFNTLHLVKYDEKSIYNEMRKNVQ